MERDVAYTKNYDQFKNNETSNIKSCTGTGKTTAIAKHMEAYMKENPHAKLLSITTRTSLCDQHVLSFKNIGMKH